MLSKIRIVYASETGNAEDLAFSLYNNIKDITGDEKLSIIDVRDYNIDELIKENLVIFVVSTTGDGDVPSKMIPFWKILLRKSIPTNCLDSIYYAVFGLGDSSYTKFNATAR
jgi:equilibrative nucleoside transporter 1/2/3